MSLEDLEKKLTERKKGKRTVSQKKPASARPVSPKTKEAKPRSGERKDRSTKKKILILLVSGFLVLASVAGVAAYAVYYYLLEGGDGLRQVDLEIELPEEIRKGVPFEVSVTILNKTDAQLLESELLLRLPPEIIYLGGVGGGEFVIRDAIGDVGGNSLLKRAFKLLPIGTSEEDQDFDEIGEAQLTATISYGTGGRARFESKTAHNVEILPAPIEIKITRPEAPIAGSFFDVEIEYKNTSNFSFPGIGIGMKYPSVFRYVSSSIPPSFMNNFWRVGELRVGSTGNLSVRGFLSDDQGRDKDLSVTVYATYLDQDYPLARKEIVFSPAPSPVKLEVFANNRTDYVASLGETIRYEVYFENQSGIALSNVELKSVLVGEMFDLDSVRIESGEINRMTGELVWNSSHIPELSFFEPGARSRISFRVNIADAFPIRRFGDKDFSVRVDSAFSSPTVPQYLESRELTSRTSLTTKIKGMVAITSRVFFRDASSGILNNGSLPPRVGQPTEYTVHWIIRNYATDVKNAEVRAVLKPGVRWTGVVKSNIDSVPVFEEETGEVVWTIGDIYAGRGMVDGPIQVVFQIEATPSQANVGFYQPLLDRAVITADDQFANIRLTSSGSALDTSLVYDPTVTAGQGLVFP